MGKIRIKTEVIEDFIKENNLTKLKFSKLCNISPKTLDKVLKKDSTLSGYIIYKIAYGMKIHGKDLLEVEKDDDNHKD